MRNTDEQGRLLIRTAEERTIRQAVASGTKENTTGQIAVCGIQTAGPAAESGPLKSGSPDRQLNPDRRKADNRADVPGPLLKSGRVPHKAKYGRTEVPTE